MELVDGWDALRSDLRFQWVIAGHGAIVTLTRLIGDNALRANAELRQALLQELVPENVAVTGVR